MADPGAGASLRISPGERVLLVRSAQIGDFLVCVPFIKELIESFSIADRDLRFLVINDSGANPVSLIFGDRFGTTNGVRVVPNNPSSTFEALPGLRRWLGRVDHVLYLPFTDEPSSSIRKKRLFLKALTGPFFPLRGLGPRPAERSQVLSLFDLYGLPRPKPGSFLGFLGLSGESEAVQAALGPSPRPVRIAVYAHSKLSMKVWPSDRYVLLCRELLSSLDCSVYFIGDKNDRAYNEVLIASIGSDRARNVAGDLSIRESVQFLSRMSALVGNDGAPLHMAALANTPTVGIYTYKAPVGMWDPAPMDRLVTLRAEAHCRGCNLVACSDPFCLTRVQVPEVLAAVHRVLSPEPVRSLQVLGAQA